MLLSVYLAGNQSITMIELASGSSTSSVLDAGTATVEELNDLNVSCTARGLPPPEVAWLKNGALLQPQNGTRRRIQLTQTDQSGTATLHVSELLLTDAGMYTCIVLGSGISSSQGETTWSFQLNVNGKHAPRNCVPFHGLHTYIRTIDNLSPLKYSLPCVSY